jgi:hypothetical protein
MQPVTIPAQGTASTCGCGNAQKSYQIKNDVRENYNYKMPGAMMDAGYGGSNGDFNSQSCQIAPPPAKRVYCSPAAFSPITPGATYQPLLMAYGNSRPAYY